jgi:hypothetical protein
MEHEDVVLATQASRNMGKHNRDIAQKIGAGAPFDAPETSFGNSASSFASRSQCGRSGMPPVMPQPTLGETISESRAEAVANKNRMRGCQDLLGGYDIGVPHRQTRRNNSLPPRPGHESLLPQAMMKLQYDGGKVTDLTSDGAAYLNSKVMMEANRSRNQAGVMLG